jgi:hypothetical protein
MSLWFDVARVSAGINVILLLALCSIWGRNYLDIRSKHVVGLLLFGLLLLGENLLALYVYLADPTLSFWFSTQVPDVAWFAMMALGVLETAGLLFLTWVTVD